MQVYHPSLNAFTHTNKFYQCSNFVHFIINERMRRIIVILQANDGYHRIEPACLRMIHVSWPPGLIPSHKPPSPLSLAADAAAAAAAQASLFIFLIPLTISCSPIFHLFSPQRSTLAVASLKFDSTNHWPTSRAKNAGFLLPPLPSPPPLQQQQKQR